MTDDIGGGRAPAGGAASKTVELPGFGKVKRVYVFGAVAAVAVIVAVAYWRRSQGGGGGEVATDYYADLRTGSDTGSDAYEGAKDSVTGDSGSAAYDAIPKTPTTDQEWTAAVVNSLTHYEPGYLYGVLGKYLARQPITTDEAAVVRAAWAAIGRPPGGQQIITAAETSTPGTPTTPNAAAAKPPARPTGLRVDSLRGTTILVRWPAVPGGKGYHVFFAGQTVLANGPAWTTNTLKPGGNYAIQVEAFNDHGTSPKSTALKFTAPKK